MVKPYNILKLKKKLLKLKTIFVAFQNGLILKLPYNRLQLLKDILYCFLSCCYTYQDFLQPVKHFKMLDFYYSIICFIPYCDGFKSLSKSISETTHRESAGCREVFFFCQIRVAHSLDISLLLQKAGVIVTL